MANISEDYFGVRVDERGVGCRADNKLLEILVDHFNIQNQESQPT